MVSTAFLFVTSRVVSADDVLAEKYAPYLYFEREEELYPVDAQYFIDNSDLYEIDNPNPVKLNPNASYLSSLNNPDLYSYFYLDHAEGTVNNNGVIDNYLDSGYDETIYYRVNNSGITKVIQYWFFYAFNDGDLNRHEGDWEMVQVVINNDQPDWVAYSQHHSGQWATWDQVERNGDHIKVYVALGSHANYLRPYSGKLGIASDTVGDNGKVLKPDSYNLINIEDQEWLDFAGRWGEFGEQSIEDAVSSAILGQSGPPGPKYRENGVMWDDPVSWGKSLLQANDGLFMAEWFIYNFIMIFIVITIITLALMSFFIYRRHKKYGLGPRIVSMFYIDGLNLKSIGNILCIIGIIIVVFGLFNTWYEVSYDFSGSGVQSLDTSGWQNLLKVDGLSGIQLTIPGEDGPMPVGTLDIPFSLIIGIGLILMIIATVGIINSKKLGLKYIWKGIRILIPIILILIVIMLIGNLIPSSESMGEDLEGASMNKIIGSISNSPMGNQESFSFSVTEGDVTETATLNLKWGLGLGGQLLLLAGIIIIISGIIELLARTQFFQPKTPVGKPPKEKSRKSKKAQEPPIAPEQPMPPSKPPKS